MRSMRGPFGLLPSSAEKVAVHSSKGATKLPPSLAGSGERRPPDAARVVAQKNSAKAARRGPPKTCWFFIRSYATSGSGVWSECRLTVYEFSGATARAQRLCVAPAPATTSVEWHSESGGVRCNEGLADRPAWLSKV